MRTLYVKWLERGRDPDTFWRCTFGEVMVLLRSYEFADELQWMHTSAQMALLANINRGKNARAYEWDDFNPYAQDKKKRKPAPKLKQQHHSMFARMTSTLNTNGKEKRSA